MQQFLMYGAFIIDLLLCLEFFDCFLTRFARIRRWEMYLGGVLLGIVQAYIFGITDTVIEKAVCYIILHALAGNMFIDAFRVVWMYLVCFGFVRIVAQIGISSIGGLFLTPYLVVIVQGLFVYYVHFYKKSNWVRNVQMQWNTLVVPAISLGLVFGFLRWQSGKGEIDYSVCYFLLFVIVTINLLYYVLVEKVEISYEMAFRRREYEERNMNYQEHYYKQLERQQREIRAIRHDMRNQLIGILGELDDGNIVRARNEMDRILKQVDSTSQLFYTANSGMNAVLNFKSKEMERKYIHFTCNADIPEQLRMNASDIGLLAGNMLDNAIEACEKCVGKKYVQFDAIYRNHTVVIVCENSTDGNVLGLETCKKDKLSHGIGIRSMKELVRQYGGEIDFEIYENSFRVTVTLFQV